MRQKGRDIFSRFPGRDREFLPVRSLTDGRGGGRKGSGPAQDLPSKEGPGVSGRLAVGSFRTLSGDSRDPGGERTVSGGKGGQGAIESLDMVREGQQLWKREGHESLFTPRSIELNLSRQKRSEIHLLDPGKGEGSPVSPLGKEKPEKGIKLEKELAGCHRSRDQRDLRGHLPGRDTRC